jgi:hypothetical protein
MKKTLLTLCISGLVTGLSAGYDESAELEWAIEATMEYAGALKSELMAAMNSGGAIEAIEVCNTRALVIGREVSLANNVNLSRVSIRNRNPANAPNEWQTAVLEAFETRKQAGEGVDTLTWHEVAETDNGSEFRFMKAIPTGGLCLQCHGPNIAPPVAEKLAELYPDDQATGFNEGDLRGAFVVTRQLD